MDIADRFTAVIAAQPVSHAVTIADDCLIRNAWICPEYLSTRQDDILSATTEHLVITLGSVLVGVVAALVLTLLVRRAPRVRAVVLSLATAVYTIPSLALFSLLLPIDGLGLSRNTVVVGLALYSLTILVRSMLTGLDSVPEEAVDAARGMGFAPSRMLWRVELPLALPTVFAGLRVAMVSTVALTTIGTIVGFGGLGNLIGDGLRSNFKAEVLTASVLCVVLAIALDLLLLGVLRLLTPWQRGRAV